MRVDIHCKKHPAYKAKFEPKAECDACWILYMLTHRIGDDTSVGIRIVGLDVHPAVLVGKERP